MAVPRLLPCWAGVALVLALTSAGCRHDSARQITGALPPPLVLSTANARSLEVPQWKAVQRWSHPVLLGWVECDSNPDPLCLPLKGGGLAYCDENWNGLLLGPSGDPKPYPWAGDHVTGADATPGAVFERNALAGTPQAEQGVWQDCTVAPRPDGGLVVISPSHLYRLDERGDVRATAALPPGVTPEGTSLLPDVARPEQIVLYTPVKGGRLLVTSCDATGQLLEQHALPIRCDRYCALSTTTTGQILVGDFARRRLDCFDPDGRPQWTCPQLHIEQPRSQLTPLAGGGLLARCNTTLYQLDGQGQCHWQLPLGPNDQYSVSGAAVITVSGPDSLHFLKPDGTEAAPPLGLPLAAKAQPAEYWSWCPNPSGGAFVRIVLDAAGAPAKNWVVAISPGGQPLWRVEVPADFELLCATDTGLLYGLQDRQAVTPATRGSGDIANAVCLVVTPPAG